MNQSLKGLLKISYASVGFKPFSFLKEKVTRWAAYKAQFVFESLSYILYLIKLSLYTCLHHNWFRPPICANTDTPEALGGNKKNPSYFASIFFKNPQTGMEKCSKISSHVNLSRVYIVHFSVWVNIALTKAHTRHLLTNSFQSALASFIFTVTYHTEREKTLNNTPHQSPWDSSRVQNKQGRNKVLPIIKHPSQKGFTPYFHYKSSFCKCLSQKCKQFTYSLTQFQSWFPKENSPLQSYSSVGSAVTLECFSEYQAHGIKEKDLSRVIKFLQLCANW